MPSDDPDNVILIRPAQTLPPVQVAGVFDRKRKIFHADVARSRGPGSDWLQSAQSGLSLPQSSRFQRCALNTAAILCVRICGKWVHAETH